jgi:capsular polysaccharide biosynthesis protein
MEVYSNDIIEDDMKDSFFFLLHKLWLIGIIGILFAVCTGLVHVYLLAPVYTSTARIYLSGQPSSSAVTLIDPGKDSQQLENYIGLVKESVVMEQVIQELKLDLSPDELAQKVTVDMAQDPYVLKINCVYSGPAMAKKIVDTTAKISLEQLVHEVDTKITIVEEGNLPTVPVIPDLSKKVILGAVSGILFAIVFLALGHLPNESVQNIEYMEQYPGCTHSVVHFLKRKLAGGEE